MLLNGFSEKRFKLGIFMILSFGVDLCKWSPCFFFFQFLFGFVCYV